tara:strand:+ start:1123 stop:2070 length:948 start_codon:yes stop_codon:yes gene_type:complete
MPRRKVDVKLMRYKKKLSQMKRDNPQLNREQLKQQYKDLDQEDRMGRFIGGLERTVKKQTEATSIIQSAFRKQVAKKDAEPEAELIRIAQTSIRESKILERERLQRQREKDKKVQNEIEAQKEALRKANLLKVKVNVEEPKVKVNVERIPPEPLEEPPLRDKFGLVIKYNRFGQPVKPDVIDLPKEEQKRLQQEMVQKRIKKEQNERAEAQKEKDKEARNKVEAEKQALRSVDKFGIPIKYNRFGQPVKPAIFELPKEEQKRLQQEMVQKRIAKEKAEAEISRLGDTGLSPEPVERQGDSGMNQEDDGTGVGGFL